MAGTNLTISVLLTGVVCLQVSRGFGLNCHDKSMIPYQREYRADLIGFEWILILMDAADDDDDDDRPADSTQKDQPPRNALNTSSANPLPPLALWIRPSRV